MDDRLRGALQAALGTTIRSTAPVHGGDVAVAHRLELDDGRRVFAKTHRDPPAGFFTTEANGLRWLGEPAVVAVPTVLAVADDPAFLVLEWIDAGRARGTEAVEAELGRSLAALHRSGAPAFGREDRRSTGSRGLPNEPLPTWVEFYATQRLLPLARLARESDALPGVAIAGLEAIAERLGELGGEPEPPARVHGDLWAGNRLVDDAGHNWLIDPAAHGGHREFDLAMMRLFGGFGSVCFSAYAEAFPLADGWERRVELHQLAPLVVHAIKFGGSYVHASEQAIRRYR
jgi:fructosamine-3-kinase